jgi:hypothetical protein
MNTKVIGLLVAILLVAGGVFFFVSGDDDSSTANNDSSQQDNNSDSAMTPNTDNFLGLNTAALQGAYQLMVTSNEDGQDLEGTFLLDGNGNVSTMVTVDGQSSGLISLDGVTYFQNPESGEWFFYPAGSASAPTFDLDDLAISNDDIDEISNDSTVEDLGEMPCSLGTCRVWSSVDPVDDETSVVKVQKDTGLLSDVELTNNATGEVTTIMYQYPGDVSITAPEGATEFELPELSQ